MNRLRFIVRNISAHAVLLENGEPVKRHVVTCALSPTVVHVDGMVYAFPDDDERVTQRRDGALSDAALSVVTDDLSAWGAVGAEFFLAVEGIDAPPLHDQVRELLGIVPPPAAPAVAVGDGTNATTVGTVNGPILTDSRRPRRRR